LLFQLDVLGPFVSSVSLFFLIIIEAIAIAVALIIEIVITTTK